MSITRTIAKNSMFNFISNGTTIFAMLIISIVLARYLGTDKYGVYSLMMWLLTLSYLVANLGFPEMVKRFVAEARGQRKSRTVKGMIQLSFMFVIPAVLLVSLLIMVLSGYLVKVFDVPDGRIYFMLIGVALLPFLMSYAFTAVFVGYQKYEYITYYELVVSPLRIGLVIILAVLGFDLTEILLANIASYVVGFFFCIFLYRRLLPVRDLFSSSLLEPAERKSAIKYSLAALGILGVDYVLWQNAEVLFLGIFRPVAEVGFYNIAHKVPSIVIALIPVVFGAVLLPAVSEQFGKGNMESIKRIYANASRYLMMLSFPIATVGIVMARPIIFVMFGSDYEPSIILMQIVFIPFAMRGLTHAVSSVIYGIKEPVFLLKIGVFLVCVSIGLNLWLIPKYGAIGAVIATSIPRMVSLPIYIYYVSRKIDTPWPLGDTMRTVLASLLMGLVLFGLQYYLSDVLGLVIGIPIGILSYVIFLLIVRFPTQQDIKMLRQIEERMPIVLRKSFAVVIRVAGKFVRQESI